MTDPIEAQFIYLGDDLEYWKELQKVFRQHFAPQRKAQYSFHHLSSRKLSELQLLEQLNEHAGPQTGVFFDFSIDNKKLKKVLNVFRNSHDDIGCRIVGLIDQLKQKEISQRFYSHGLWTVFIKGVETFDPVFFLHSQVLPASTKDPEFARAHFQEDASFSLAQKIKFLSRDRVVTESAIEMAIDEEVPFLWEEGQIIYGDHRFKVMKSGPMGVVDPVMNFRVEWAPRMIRPMSLHKQREWLRWRKSYLEQQEGVGGDTKLVSVENSDDVSEELVLDNEDEKVSPLLQLKEDEDGDELEPIDEVIFSLKENVARSLAEWPLEIHERPRLLVLSKNSKTLLEAQDLWGKRRAEVVAKQSLSVVDRELTNLCPHIIVLDFNNDQNQVSDAKELLAANGEYTLDEVVSWIRGQYEYWPEVHVFNYSQQNSQKLRDRLGFSFIWSYSKDLGLDSLTAVVDGFFESWDERVLSLAKKELAHLEAKNPRRYKGVFPEDLMEKKLVNDEHHHLGPAKLSLGGNIISLTENEIVFTCDKNLPIGAALFMDRPVSLALTLIPKSFSTPGQHLTNSYRGFIHTINESEKQKLRKFVNSIFGLQTEVQRRLTAQELGLIKKKVFQGRT